MGSQDGSLSNSHTTIFPGPDDGEFDKTAYNHHGSSPTTSALLGPTAKDDEDFPADFDFDTLFFRYGIQHYLAIMHIII